MNKFNILHAYTLIVKKHDCAEFELDGKEFGYECTTNAETGETLITYFDESFTNEIPSPFTNRDDERHFANEVLAALDEQSKTP